MPRPRHCPVDAEPTDHDRTARERLAAHRADDGAVGLRDERHVAGVEGVEHVLGALVQRRDVGSVDLGLGDERAAHGGGDRFGLISCRESDDHAVGQRGHRLRRRRPRA